MFHNISVLLCNASDCSSDVDTSPPLYVPGVNTMANYEQVLHLIRYKNWHTEALFDRKFKLVCSELNGRYISNDFKVEV